MPEFLSAPTVQAGLSLLVLCILIAAGFYLVSIFRGYAAEDRETTSDVLFKLEEMHRKGDISDEEFRTIESTTHRHLDGSGTNDDPASGNGSTSDH